MLGLWPQDEQNLFDGPIVTVTVAVAGWGPLIPADPSRVLLLISSDGTAGAFVLPGGGQPAGATTPGYALIPNAPALVLTYNLHGPLVSAEWQATGITGNANVTTVEYFLRRNPAHYGHDGVFPQNKSAPPSNSNARQRGARMLSGIGRSAVLPRALRERLPGILGTE